MDYKFKFMELLEKEQKYFELRVQIQDCIANTKQQNYKARQRKDNKTVYSTSATIARLQKKLAEVNFLIKKTA